ncbi:hypothetical protein GCM10007916_29010 [Psychromonas marina]|uniref:Uncharacterized protein n=1 Tax=Psychromonas marina TaxID=88364 RepID=A0ABQ6E497_9GAMM|nr:hypothetical protein [Psychromonas marina]GLS91831.1 hypothetical protein GCM10007916_29010 [Psychromonas marina]
MTEYYALKNYIFSLVITTLTGCFNTITALTLNDVMFEQYTSAIVGYKSNYKDIAILNHLGCTLVTGHFRISCQQASSHLIDVV